jgi:hypothetical protein
MVPLSSRRLILFQLLVSQPHTHLTVGQIVVGYMCDKMLYVQVMLFSALFSAIAAFTLLGFASSLPLVFVFVVIFGSLVSPIAIARTDSRPVDSRQYRLLQQSKPPKVIPRYEPPSFSAWHGAVASGPSSVLSSQDHCMTAPETKNPACTVVTGL